ncbi:MAG: hypothetical protein WCD18_15400 [Thermosynechococcaceae cyanobacterium]
MAKISSLFQVLALIALSLFSGALLFIAIAIVKFWQAAEPDIFLSWMGENFFRFPTIMVPLNMVSLLLIIAALATSWRSNPTNRLPLGLGLISLFLCTITFPIYFAGANAEFVTHAVDLTDVAEKIEIWSNWHWFRTGLVMLAIGFVSWALLNQGNEVSKTP